MLKQTLNKGISTPIAIGIVLILVIIVGSFTWWQYGKMWKEIVELPEIEIPEKKEMISSFDQLYKLYVCSKDSDCILIDSRACGGSIIKVSINKKYESSYTELRSRYFNEEEICPYIGISADEHNQVNKGIIPVGAVCVDNTCRPKYPEDETDGWKTYRNEEYGYEIKYPKDWTVSENILNAFDIYKSFNNYNCSIEIYANIRKYLYPIEENEGYFQGFSESKIFTKEEVASIGDISGKKLLSPELAGREIYFFRKEIGSNYYYFNIFLDVTKSDYYGERIIEENKCKDIFKEMLLTFQFTDKITDKLITEPICKYRKGEYEMRMYDSEGRMTGIKDGEIKEEIPGSYYNPRDTRPDLDCPTCQTISIPDTTGIYRFEIFCIKEGNYKFGQNFAAAGELLSFKAINIPIVSGVTHRYDFDWESLAKDREGVAIFIDLDNDDLFEKLITSDEELTCEEFITQLKKR